VELQAGLHPDYSRAASSMLSICCENPVPHAGKTPLGVTSAVRTRGAPHPHASSLACASFFVHADGVLHRVFSANTQHRTDIGTNNPSPAMILREWRWIIHERSTLMSAVCGEPPCGADRRDHVKRGAG
jgi:hypothetical protein